MTNETGPLSGIKVVELAANFTGPLASMLLGDQGADIIKVESGTGDQMRYAGARRVKVDAMSTVFLSANRNKRSVVLDLRNPEDAGILREIVSSCDVVIQNFRPGVIDRLGFGYRDVCAYNRNVVYLSIDGVGNVGPESGRRVYDVVIQGMAGIADVQRDSSTGEPRLVQNSIADKVTALFAFQAVTAALFSRLRNGRGQHIRLSMLEALICFMWPDAMSNFTLVGEDVKPASPTSEAKIIFRTKDSFLLAVPVSDADWIALATAVQRTDLIGDERFSSIGLRLGNTVALHEELKETFAQRTTDEWCDALRAADAVFSPISSIQDLHLQEQVRALGTIVELGHPVAGCYRQPVHPAHFSETPAGIHRHAPSLGEHTNEVLKEIRSAC